MIKKRPGEPVPKNRREAMRSNHWDDYFEAEKFEMETHKKNGTWHLVDLADLPREMGVCGKD
jgi:hypothetical protein